MSFNNEISDKLLVSKFHPEIKIIEVNTNIDHMHMMISIPPKMSVSSVVRLIKTNTGKAMRERFPFLNKVYWGVEGIWSIGYFMSIVHPREVIKPAIKESASSIIFLHNHPSGDPEPSLDDIEVTRRLCKSCSIVGISVLDHIIVAEGGYFSFKQKNMI